MTLYDAFWTTAAYLGFLMYASVAAAAISYMVGRFWEYGRKMGNRAYQEYCKNHNYPNEGGRRNGNQN